MRILIISILLIATSSLSAQLPKDTVLVFFLGGQSNMEGYGYNKDLPKDLSKTIDDVYIFQATPLKDDTIVGGQGKWEELKPGHGLGFRYDKGQNLLSERFGIELSFAQQLKAHYPKKKIALIKYAKGGSAIDSMANRYGCWEPDYSGINQYEHALNTIKTALSNTDINGDGEQEILVPAGIIWMQGESDAFLSEAIALRYLANLKRLMDLLRASLHDNNLPIVIGKISDSWDTKIGKVWPYGELVQYAQENFARKDRKASIVRDTRYYKYTDQWHYDSESYIHLGQRFADEVHQLNQR